EGEITYARGVAPGPIEACDQAELDGVGTNLEDDGNRIGCGFGRNRCGVVRCGDDGHLTSNQVGRHCGQPIGLILRPAIFDQNITAVDKTGFAQPQAKCRYKIGSRLKPAAMEKSDYRHRGLLAPPRERPRRGRAAEQRDERAALYRCSHLITSSARASSDGGTVRPSTLAACALMTSSNLVDCTTGSSAGFAPLRMRPA